MTAVLIIAHEPLASALRDAAMHVYPECAAQVLALDVQAALAPEDTLACAELLLTPFGAETQVLLLTDVVGATPCNVAERLCDGRPTRKLLAGVNLPMLLRTLCYRHEDLETLAARAQAGGVQGIASLSVTAPQNQTPSHHHDRSHHHHQQ